MELKQHLKIDNSLESANKDGSSKRTTADFYKKIMKKVEWKELLKEAYLIAPVENIQNDENGITLFVQCELVYPHHEIYNDKLILSIPKLKKVFVEVVKEKNYYGEIKSHLEHHMKDLNEKVDFNAVLSFDYDGMEEIIEEGIRELCSGASDTYITKTRQYMYEELKYEQARKDAKYWFDNGTYRQSQNLSLEEKYDIAEELIFRHFAFNPWNFWKELK